MLKNVLVHLAGGASDEAVLATANWIAQPFAGHLDCVHFHTAAASLAAEAVLAGPSEDSAAITERFAAYKARARDGMRAAHLAFTAFCKKEALPHIATPPAPDRVNAAWREIIGGEPADLAGEARFHDLAVVGLGTELSDGLSARDIGNLVLHSGRPVLLASDKPLPGALRTIAIAWKDTPEAARALTTAMPLLALASRIVVFTANEENAKAVDCIDCSDKVAQSLRWHGLRAESRYVIPAGRDVPDAVLDSAHEMSADLLVMGAYGRSRLRETLFGGFTQRVLRGSDLPVFLFH